MKQPRPPYDCQWLHGARGYWLLGALTAALLALCAPFDLAVARGAYQPENRFGLFLRKFGEYPGHSLLLFSAGAYLLYGRHVLIRVLMALLFCLEIYIFIEKHHPVASFIEGAVVYSLILFPPLAILGARRFLSAAQMARSAGLVVLAGVLHPLLLVQVIKKLWGRVRFNDLGEGTPQFTPWYLPQGINDHHSFPSGHTAMGIMACFVVLYLPRHLRGIAFLPLFAWALAVGASRVILGAHYVSDVVFSLAVGLGLLLHFHRINTGPDRL